MLFIADRAFGRPLIRRQPFVEAGEHGGEGRALIPQPVNQLDHERVGRNRGAELVDQVVLRLPGAAGTEQMIGDRVGLPALVAAVDDTLGDPAQILDQDDAQGDRRSPQFANRERLLLLIGVDEGAPGIDIEAAVGVRDERPDESEHPRQSGEGPVGELGQLAVISRR